VVGDRPERRTDAGEERRRPPHRAAAWMVTRANGGPPVWRATRSC